MGHHEYRPLADMLVEMAERYGKPMFLSETGAEGIGQAVLAPLCLQRGARRDGPRRRRSRGICWYPITAYPGWDNSRHAETGLLSTVVADGSRHVDQRLLEEFEVQRALFGACAGDAGDGRPPRLGDRRGLRSSDGVPTNGQPSRHSMRSISRIRRLLISSSCRWRGRFTSIA